MLEFAGISLGLGRPCDQQLRVGKVLKTNGTNARMSLIPFNYSETCLSAKLPRALLAREGSFNSPRPDLKQALKVVKTVSTASSPEGAPSPSVL